MDWGVNRTTCCSTVCRCWEYFLESIHSYLTGWSSADAQQQTSKMCNSWVFHCWESFIRCLFQSRFGFFFNLFILSAYFALAELKVCLFLCDWQIQKRMFGLHNKDDGVHLSKKLRGNLSGSFVWQGKPNPMTTNDFMKCYVSERENKWENKCFYFTALTDIFWWQTWLLCVQWR